MNVINNFDIKSIIIKNKFCKIDTVMKKKDIFQEEKIGLKWKSSTT